MIGVIGILIVLIFIEMGLSLKTKNGVYNARDSFSNIMFGLAQQVIGVLFIPLLLFIYNELYQHHSLWHIPHSLGVTIIYLFFSDFCFYVFHRISHRSNLFIAIHIIHHQVEDYNFVSAIRQSWASRYVAFTFYIPLAIIGFAPETFFLGQLIIFVMQFLTHNGTFKGSYGPLERIFVSPRHHRVHHGINRNYRDRNYGGIFSIWDRLLGTFEPLDPRTPVKIGITGKTNHHDFINGNIHYFKSIYQALGLVSGIKEKLRVLFGTPEFLAKILESKMNPGSAPKKALTKKLVNQLIFYTALLVIVVAILMSIEKTAEVATKLIFIGISLGLVGKISNIVSGKVEHKTTSHRSDIGVTTP